MGEPLVLHDGTGEAVRVPGIGSIIYTGATIPSNGGAGYAPGCLFLLYQTYSGDTQWYVNSGTNSSATWTAIDLTEAAALAGLTATATELNKLAGVVAGTTSASKALVVDANKALDTLALPASGLKIGAGAGTAVTTTAAELNANAGVTAGTAAASKTVVLDANTSIAGMKETLGAATTVQSQAVLGIAPDLTGAASGTTQSTFYALATVTVPANAMSANGKGFFFAFSGVTASNANAKDFRLNLGATAVTITTGNTGNAQPIVCTGWVFRTAAGAQRVVAELIIGTASPIPINTTAAADETTALAVSIQSQNTAAAAASATGNSLILNFQN